MNLGDIDRIPVRNLYKAFTLFAALLYLHYEQVDRIRSSEAFVLLIVGTAAGFLLWYAFERQAHAIQLLVVTLNSYRMNIHVPANLRLRRFFASDYDWRDFSHPSLSRNKKRPPSSLHVFLNYPYGLMRCIKPSLFILATILGTLWVSEAWGGLLKVGPGKQLPGAIIFFSSPCPCAWV